LGFLGGWPFRCETSVFSCWISLDFLGFSRPNLDHQGVTRIFRKKEILAPFSPAEALEGSPGPLGIHTRRIAHAASLTRFPIFRNKFCTAGFPVSTARATGGSARERSEGRPAILSGVLTCFPPQRSKPARFAVLEATSVLGCGLVLVLGSLVEREEVVVG
jgi:hypothetical protein